MSLAGELMGVTNCSVALKEAPCHDTEFGKLQKSGSSLQSS